MTTIVVVFLKIHFPLSSSDAMISGIKISDVIDNNPAIGLCNVHQTKFTVQNV